jgi:hypothetical protein
MTRIGQARKPQITPVAAEPATAKPATVPLVQPRSRLRRIRINRTGMTITNRVYQPRSSSRGKTRHNTITTSRALTRLNRIRLGCCLSRRICSDHTFSETSELTRLASDAGPGAGAGKGTTRSSAVCGAGAASVIPFSPMVLIQPAVSLPYLVLPHRRSCGSSQSKPPYNCQGRPQVRLCHYPVSAGPPSPSSPSAPVPKAPPRPSAGLLILGRRRRCWCGTGPSTLGNDV